MDSDGRTLEVAQRGDIIPDVPRAQLVKIGDAKAFQP
jgi:hypothetical protein